MPGVRPGTRTLRTAAASLALLLGSAGGGVHPADGPDVDVRVRIGSDKVVFAILMNLAFVDEVIEPFRMDDTYLHPVEYEGMKEALVEHYRDTNRVTIDGVDVAPIAREFEVEDADLSMLPLFPRMGTLALVKLRLVLEYPTVAPPRRVSFAWGSFPRDLAIDTGAGEVPPITVIAQLNAKGLKQRIALTADEPEFTWHDTGESLVDHFAAVPAAPPPPELEVPALSAGLLTLALAGSFVLIRGGIRRRPWLALAVPVLCIGGLVATDVGRVSIADPLSAGAALPSDEEALAVFEPLHANIYRAFDYVDESEIYDALARSVDGPLLERLYAQIYRGLIMQEEGGAVSEVQSVTPVETSVESIGLLPPEDAPGFTVATRWQVEGAVFHWGHSHHRTNEYHARYTVAQTEAGWRIRDHEILEQLVVSTSSTDPRQR